MSQNQNQNYPEWQLKMEKYQLALNQGAVDGDMKKVGKYSAKINELDQKVHGQK